MTTQSKTPSKCPFSIFYPCWLQYKGKRYNNIYELYQHLMDWNKHPDVDALYRCYQIRLKQDAQLKYYLLASSGLSYECEIHKWNSVIPFKEFYELLKFKAIYSFDD